MLLYRARGANTAKAHTALAELSCRHRTLLLSAPVGQTAPVDELFALVAFTQPQFTELAEALGQVCTCVHVHVYVGASLAWMAGGHSCESFGLQCSVGRRNCMFLGPKKYNTCEAAP